MISRERYLDDGYKGRLMRDVRSVELAVSRQDATAIEAMLRAAGLRVSRQATILVARGSETDFLIRIVPDDSIGLRRIEFVLNASVRTQHVERIGRSVLTVGPGAHAVWTFS